jgi:hypothetical protein
MATGYSGTPLPKKIGLKDGGTLVLVNPPIGMVDEFQPLPIGATVSNTLKPNCTLAILFCPNIAALKKNIIPTAAKLNADGALWISWPKKSSALFVDLTEDIIRDIILPLGLVDVKVCAVNLDWSGLKLMVRKELRASWSQQGNNK